MRTGFQRGFAALLMVAVGIAANLHLPLVQAVAWTRMYAQYRQAFPAKVALEITFSGEYPCPLCKMVVAAEKERHNLDGIQSPLHRTLLLPLPRLAAVSVEAPVAKAWHWQMQPSGVPAGFTQPETPPPRLA